MKALASRDHDAIQQCWKAAEALELRAGAAATPKARDAFFSHSGLCYQRGGAHREAGEAFIACRQYDDGVMQFLKAADYHRAVQVARQHKPLLRAATFEHAINTSRDYYLTVRVSTAMLCFKRDVDF